MQTGCSAPTIYAPCHQHVLVANFSRRAGLGTPDYNCSGDLLDLIALMTRDLVNG
jgi:hypothetical protein